MTYVSTSTVRISTWVKVSAGTEICYQVLPVEDIIEFTLGGNDGLELLMDEAGLRHCIETFTNALAAFDAREVVGAEGRSEP